MGLLAEANYATGLLEKRNPLPVGRYWIDVFTDFKIEQFDQWLQLKGFDVTVLSREHTDNDISILVQPGQFTPSHDWILFKVNAPVSWLSPADFGWPTVADKSIQNSGDTVQKPEPEILPPEFWWVPWAVGGTIGVIGLYALAKLVRG